MTQELSQALAYIRKRTGFVPRLAMVLGSGLGNLAQKVEAQCVLPFEEIPHFPVSTVSGHAGKLILGQFQGIPVAVMQGRVHYYEGYSMKQVVFPIGLLKQLGAGILLLTNAAGGINQSFCPGDFMLITGHISSLVPSPFIGREEALYPRFPDMSQVYDLILRQCMETAAEQQGILLRQGVYLQVTGPNYETPEEIRMYGAWGADAVGMSTACEAAMAKAMGMRVCGVSLISNKAAGLSENPLSHSEVRQAGERAAKDFERLLSAGVAAMGALAPKED